MRNPFDEIHQKYNFTAFLRTYVDELDIGDSVFVETPESRPKISGALTNIGGKKFSTRKPLDGEQGVWIKRVL